MAERGESAVEASGGGGASEEGEDRSVGVIGLYALGEKLSPSEVILGLGYRVRVEWPKPPELPGSRAAYELARVIGLYGCEFIYRPESLWRYNP
jgi:hypothetical protein